MSMRPSGSHLAALGLGVGIGAGAQLLACCGWQPPQPQPPPSPPQQLADGGEPTLRRRVKLSAADPASTPIRDDLVAAALAALGPALAEPGSVRLEPRRSFAMATFTASSEEGMVALNQALVATMMGQGLDLGDGWSAGDGGRDSTKRWHVTLADDHQGSSVYFDERAARAHNFATLFAKGAGRMDDSLRVTLCGVDDPLNVGLVMRLLTCFGASTLYHLSYETGGDAGFWARRETLAKIKRVAKGGACKRYLPLQTMPAQRWVLGRCHDDGGGGDDDDADACATGACNSTGLGGTTTSAAATACGRGRRLPVIALETARGAVSLCEFSFPEHCEIMVGAEDSGISAEVIGALQPERGDAVVYVPLPGVYHSLNVATALSIALYEYRRQWPGQDTTTSVAGGELAAAAVAERA